MFDGDGRPPSSEGDKVNISGFGTFSVSTREGPYRAQSQDGREHRDRRPRGREVQARQDAQGRNQRAEADERRAGCVSPRRAVSSAGEHRPYMPGVIRSNRDTAHSCLSQNDSRYLARKYSFHRGGSSVRLERRPVTSEVAGSSPVHPAIFRIAQERHWEHDDEVDRHADARRSALAARRWFVIDAQDRVLGRVASEAAKLLRGKGKPGLHAARRLRRLRRRSSTPSRCKLTGREGSETKIYYRHSRVSGRHPAQTAGSMRATHPERLLRAGDHRHAAEEPSRPAAGDEAQDLRRAGASARRAAAGGHRPAGWREAEESAMAERTTAYAAHGQAEDRGRARSAPAGRWQDHRQPAHARGLLRPPDVCA